MKGLLKRFATCTLVLGLALGIPLALTGCAFDESQKSEDDEITREDVDCYVIIKNTDIPSIHLAKSMWRGDDWYGFKTICGYRNWLNGSGRFERLVNDKTNELYSKADYEIKEQLKDISTAEAEVCPEFFPDGLE